MDAPRQVRRAIALLWISFFISVVESLVVEPIDPSEPVLWIILAAVFAIWGYVIYAISRQRGWGRVIVLLVLVLTVAVYLAWPDMMFEDAWWHHIGTGVSFVLEAVALMWLYTEPGASWFKKRGE